MTTTSSPLLFDFDESEFPTYSSPTMTNANDSFKSEPDLTIPLGWDNDSLNRNGTISTTGRQRHHSESIYHNPNHHNHNHNHNHLNIPHSDSSVPYPATVPSLAPTSTANNPPLFPADFWHPDYLNTFDSLTVDPKSLGQFSDPLMNNANTSIPWSQWTNVNAPDSDSYHTRDDLDMPPTPVDAFSINVDLYQPIVSSDLTYSHSSNQNQDLLSPFNSLGLSSPPMQSAAIQPNNCINDSQTRGLNISFGSPSMYYDSNAIQFDTPSPPVSIPPNNLDLKTVHVKILPSSHHISQTHRAHNNISALSSSLPASFTSPQPHSSAHLSKPSPNSRASPPTQPQNNPMRSTRSRAMSDVSSRPVHRRRGHSAQEISEPSPSTDPLKPPKQSLSTWQFFFTEWIQKQDGRKLNVAQAAKEAGKEYKLLSDEEKEPYARRAAAARLNRQQALSDWHQTLTPSLIALENRYRTAQRKLGLSRRSNLKDPNAPKKPLSAYFMFLKAVREDSSWSDSVFKGEKETTRQSVLAAARWREMSDDEKRPFLARAEHEKLQYEAARKEYEDSFSFEDNNFLEGSGLSSQKHFVTPQELSSPRPRSNSTGSRAMAFRLDDLSSEVNRDGSPSMGYFSASPSTDATIPIHIPKRRSRSGSTPSPNVTID